MRSQIFKLAKFLIGWPLSLLALYYIWQMIAPQWKNLADNLANINVPLFSAGIASFLVFYFLRSYIWYKLLQDQSHHIPYKQVSFLWAISEIKRYIPGKVWFVLGRTVAFSELGVGKKETGLLLMIELEIFTVTALIISLLSIPFFLHYFSGFPSINLLAILFFIAIFTGSLFYIFNERLTKKLPEKLKKISNTLLPKNKPRTIILLLFISCISLLFYGFANYFIISSIIFLHPQLLWQLVGLFNLSFVLGFLSFFAPSGLGVREGIMASGLSKIMTFSQAGFASLFVRLILIISELIFIAISYLWLKIKNKRFLQIERWIANHPQEFVVICLVLLYSVYFTLTSFLRYDNYYTGRFDLGNMVQTVWNTAQGRIFILTDPNGTEIVSRLAFHADFILVLLAPFYYIWANPKMLLLIQAISTAAGAIFIFLIAKDILKSKNLALTFSFMYLINPSIQRANIYDFHAVTLATCFLLGTYYFYRKKRYVLFTTFALLASLTKEQIWVIIALFGIFLFVFHRKRLFGTQVFLISAFMFYFLIWHAIPGALGANHFALSYFSDFGSSPGDIIKSIVFSPDKTIATILEPDRLEYLNQLFLPVGFLSVFSPLYLIFALPDLLINLLSSNNQLHQIYYQYTTAINPFIYITAIMGAAIIKKITKLPNIFLILYLLTVSVYGAFLYGPLPGAKGANLNMYTKPVNNRDFIEKYLSSIPQDASVSASNNIGSHLSERQRIYTVPKGLQEADYVVFLLTGSMDKEREMIQELKQNNQYFLDIETSTFIVFRKKVI